MYLYCDICEDWVGSDAALMVHGCAYCPDCGSVLEIVEDKEQPESNGADGAEVLNM
jgi:hypothetical protein